MKTNTKKLIGLGSRSAQLSSNNSNTAEAQTAPVAVEKKDNRLPIDSEARMKNRTLPTTKVLELLKTSNPGLFNLAEVVGYWIWVAFRETPAPELRQQLAQLGFHWNRERQAWQHPCGKFRLGSMTDPHQKYSSYFIDARFNELRYRRLFPAWWRFVRIRNPGRLREAVGGFWKQLS
jgi:hypothetical protein